MPLLEMIPLIGWDAWGLDWLDNISNLVSGFGDTIDKPYMFRMQWLRRLCDKAGVKRFGCHGIRHLCASILAEKGIPTIDIKEHLRHEHLATTEKYVYKLKENRSVI